MSDPTPPRLPRLSPSVAAVRHGVRSVVSEAARTGSSDRPAVIVVAFSGGADSTALLRAALFEAADLPLRVIAVSVDHGLQAGSDAVAAAAAARALSWGAHEAIVERVSVGTEGGMEAAARTARYEALDRVAAEHAAVAILLGHTFDDQAETVLLGLTRGSGPHSIRGMPAADGLYRRPLLNVRRENTRAACDAESAEFWDDPHNVNTDFTRVRIRNTVLPMLEAELGPGVASALVRTARLVSDDDDALDNIAEAIVDDVAASRDGHLAIPVATIADQPRAIRSRVIRLCAGRAFGASMSLVHTDAIDALVTDWRGQKPLNVPGGNVERHGGHLVFTPA